jgi:hypothetical protein
MLTSSNDLNINESNREVPFFPSKSWIITTTDYDDISLTLPAFMWVQAFFDATVLANAQLAVWGGKYNPNNTIQANIVRFAYSGQMIMFKGKGILTSGIDFRGTTITSTPLGANPNELSQIIVYGGAY